MSTVYRGVAFEKKCLRLLHDNLSMSLRRVGGKSDGGVDLIGWWWLPQSIITSSSRDNEHTRIRVLAQCKAEKKKIGPHYIRELEGVVSRHLYANSPKHENDPLVALFLSESQFTKATILRAISSPVPFLLLHVPPGGTSAPSAPQEELEDDASVETEDESESSGNFGSAMWNPALGSSMGLLRGLVDLRWERSLRLGRSETASGRPGLWLVGGGKVGNCIPEGGHSFNEDWDVEGTT
ncbi:hypothetical protein DL96DRAFT_1579728, partial [Flagelloscypha sp. PMI_526]